MISWLRRLPQGETRPGLFEEDGFFFRLLADVGFNLIARLAALIPLASLGDLAGNHYPRLARVSR